MIPLTHPKTLGLAASLLALAGAAGPALAAPKALASLTVSNPLGTARTDEVIDLPLAEVRAHAPGVTASTVVVRDAATGADCVTQAIDEGPAPGGAGHPDRLLIQLDMAPHQTRTLQFFAVPHQPPFVSRVFARFAPERKDDFAWENDQIAFRMYGPALQATGEVSSGVDVWSKRVPRMILNEWYTRADEAALFGAEGVHDDHGTGLDCYKVEPARGCGGTAIWDGSKFLVSKNYVSYKIMAQGPIRTEFELTYAPWDAGGTQVSEVKRITLDAGSHLNKMQSTYTFSGPATLTAAAAVVEHVGYSLQTPPDHRYIAMWEPGDKPATATHNATALVAAPGTAPQYKEALGHGIYLYTIRSGKPMTFYAGAGWSNYTVPTQAAWTAYLTDFTARLAAPLKTRWGQ